jgi:hypothetical protein
MPAIRWPGPLHNHANEKLSSADIAPRLAYMNEILAKLLGVTGNPDYLKTAEAFVNLFIARFRRPAGRRFRRRSSTRFG